MPRWPGLSSLPQGRVLDHPGLSLLFRLKDTVLPPGNLPREVVEILAEVPAERRKGPAERTLARRIGKTQLRRMTKVRTNLHYLLRLSPRVFFSLMALSMLANAGLSVAKAVSVAAVPIAGRITRCLSAWQTITRDKWVLNMVRYGYKLQFKSRLPPT